MFEFCFDMPLTFFVDFVLFWLQIPVLAAHISKLASGWKNPNLNGHQNPQ
jgi:hypothetical protein